MSVIIGGYIKRLLSKFFFIFAMGTLFALNLDMPREIKTCHTLKNIIKLYIYLYVYNQRAKRRKAVLYHQMTEREKRKEERKRERKNERKGERKK